MAGRYINPSRSTTGPAWARALAGGFGALSDIAGKYAGMKMLQSAFGGNAEQAPEEEVPTGAEFNYLRKKEEPFSDVSVASQADEPSDVNDWLLGQYVNRWAEELPKLTGQSGETSTTTVEGRVPDQLLNKLTIAPPPQSSGENLLAQKQAPAAGIGVASQAAPPVQAFGTSAGAPPMESPGPAAPPSALAGPQAGPQPQPALQAPPGMAPQQPQEPQVDPQVMQQTKKTLEGVKNSVTKKTNAQVAEKLFNLAGPLFFINPEMGMKALLYGIEMTQSQTKAELSAELATVKANMQMLRDANTNTWRNSMLDQKRTDSDRDYELGQARLAIQRAREARLKADAASGGTYKQRLAAAKAAYVGLTNAVSKTFLRTDDPVFMEMNEERLAAKEAYNALLREKEVPPEDKTPEGDPVEEAMRAAGYEVKK